MIGASASESPFSDRIRGESGKLTWLGVGFLVLGIAALVFPYLFTLAATFFVGWIFLISGIGAVFTSFSIRGTGPFFGALLLGLLSVAAGAFLLFRPGVGALMLTMTVGILFMFQGASELFVALEARPLPAWGWMLLSAIASVLLGFVIIAGWPGSSMATLGILIGVNFISSGVGYLALARTAKGALAKQLTP
jgi:uncharacterized membrane protein HdeD (DUF308 family)